MWGGQTLLSTECGQKFGGMGVREALGLLAWEMGLNLGVSSRMSGCAPGHPLR